MAKQDCRCHRCLCFHATSDVSRVCSACRGDEHPGDPRPYAAQARRRMLVEPRTQDQRQTSAVMPEGA